MDIFFLSNMMFRKHVGSLWMFMGPNLVANGGKYGSIWGQIFPSSILDPRLSEKTTSLNKKNVTVTGKTHHGQKKIHTGSLICI